MNIQDFGKSGLPRRIKHPSWGESELHFKEDEDGDKMAGYRNKDGFSSYGVIGNTWLEVYERLTDMLVKDGHLNNMNSDKK